jgi:hypothetical protein
MIVALLYQLTQRLLSVPVVLLGHDTAKDAELVGLKYSSLLVNGPTGQVETILG